MPDLRTRLVSGLVFPLQERLKKHSTVADRRAMEDSQWWPRERLEALRVQRLRALLTHAASHVPYYRDLFARIGFDPAAMSSLTDLQRLPFLDKPLIRAHTDALKADDARGLARFNTGGSSGVPLIFYTVSNASAATSPPNGGPPAGGASISVTRRSCCGAARSNWARRTACVCCAIA